MKKIDVKLNGWQDEMPCRWAEYFNVLLNGEPIDAYDVEVEEKLFIVKNQENVWLCSLAGGHIYLQNSDTIKDEKLLGR